MRPRHENQPRHLSSPARRPVVFLVALSAVAVLVALAPPASSGAPAAPEGILVEMEQPTKREYTTRAFCLPVYDTAGSGFFTVKNFHNPENKAFYEFTIKNPGRYTGWLRYGTNDDKQRLRAALDPQSDADFTNEPLPSTGGYEGPGCWGWIRLFDRELTAGAHTLVVRGCSMRPDAVYIWTRDEKPTDDVLSALGEVPLTPEQQRLLEENPVPVTPDWLEGTQDYRLPDWFDGARVQAHTRLWPRMREDEIFLTAAREFRSLGLQVYTRHVKSHDEGAWWPTKAGGGVEPWATDRNWAKEIIDNAHEVGCRIIAYHRHMEDAWTAENHPEWLCRDWTGAPVPTATNRGLQVCFNSPFPEFVLDRMLELVDMGADGIFFDETHMPKIGCWCDYCREKFKEETGLDLPPAANPRNPVWNRQIDFNNLTMERTFLYWRKGIHERNPECVMLVGNLDP